MIKTQHSSRFGTIARQPRKKRQQSFGFTMIELLIVLAITGILASITYPSYRNYIIRAHRIDGQSALLDLACRMETYYTAHGTWRTATIGTGKPTDVLSQHQSPEGWYFLSLLQVTDTTYILQATPSNMQDTLCQSLTLTNSGTKGITGTGIMDISQCWG